MQLTTVDQTQYVSLGGQGGTSLTGPARAGETTQGQPPQQTRLHQKTALGNSSPYSSPRPRFRSRSSAARIALLYRAQA